MGGTSPGSCQEGSCHQRNRPPLSLTNPDDVPEALPPGKVKLLAFALVFFLWVGGWGALDVVITMISENPVANLLSYLAMMTMGAIGLRILARRYRGYAL